MALHEGLVLKVCEEEKDIGMDKDTWGSGRAWGALSWGLTHVIMGFTLEHSRGF